MYPLVDLLKYTINKHMIVIWGTTVCTVLYLIVNNCKNHVHSAFTRYYLHKIIVKNIKNSNRLQN